MANALTQEIREAYDENTSRQGKASIHQVISGKVLKKYKVVEEVYRKTGISGKSLRHTNTKRVQAKKTERLKEQREIMKKEVIDFLERDDNSQAQPGKADTVKSDTGIITKRILTDYMVNIHSKFQMEKPEINHVPAFMTKTHNAYKVDVTRDMSLQ